MKFEIPVRIIVEQPLSGVEMMVQKGRHELVSPAAGESSAIVFDVSVRGVFENGEPNFLPGIAQGPKGGRFIYVNSGTSAGDAASCWSRRAKLSLMSVTKEQIEQVLADDGRVLQTTIPGRGRDGGPICASVKGLVWTVEKR